MTSCYVGSFLTPPRHAFFMHPSILLVMQTQTPPPPSDMTSFMDGPVAMSHVNFKYMPYWNRSIKMSIITLVCFFNLVSIVFSTRVTAIFVTRSDWYSVLLNLHFSCDQSDATNDHRICSNQDIWKIQKVAWPPGYSRHGLRFKWP